MNEPLQIVGTGIDTVKVNVKYLDEDGKPRKTQEVPERLQMLFSAWQEEAREENKPLVTSMTFHYARMLMLPNGAQAWQYIIKNDCLQLSISPRLKVPMIAKVTLSSSYLWSMGSVQDAVDEVHGFLIDVFGTEIMLQVAQMDLCVDMVGLVLPTEWRQVFVTHAIGKSAIHESEKDKEYYRGSTLETIMFSGHGRPVSLKIYLKTNEIRQRSPDKKWFYDIWKKQGWDGKQPVWRVEYSIERFGWHEMDIEDIYDALRNLKRAWEYCTQWLRMVTPGHTKNRTRWRTHPTWQTLQHAFDDYGCKVVDILGPLVRERKREANIERGVAAMAGYATTLAAWCDMELDPEQCAAELFGIIYDKVVERWQKQNTSPVDIIQEKKFLYSQKP